MTTREITKQELEELEPGDEITVNTKCESDRYEEDKVVVKCDHRNAKVKTITDEATIEVELEAWCPDCERYVYATIIPGQNGMEFGADEGWESEYEKLDGGVEGYDAPTWWDDE